MKTPFPKAYIVVLNYNGWRDTIECLESILKSDYPNFEMVVVDNDSKDGSFEYILDWASGCVTVESSEEPIIEEIVFPLVSKPLRVQFWPSSPHSTMGRSGITLVKADKNNGFSSGNNIGMRISLADPECEYIWLLNNDTVIPKNTLSQLIQFHQLHSTSEKLGILGNPLAYYHQPLLRQAYAGRFNKWTCTPEHVGENQPLSESCSNAHFDYVIGASMLISAEYVEDVGLLDERYFLYFEELDWTERGKIKGWTTRVADQVVIYHKHGASTGNNQAETRSEFSDIVLVQSRLLFLKKHFPWLLLNVIITFPAVLVNRVRRNQGKRIPCLIRALLKGLFRKTSGYVIQA